MIHYWDKKERYQGILFKEDEKLGERFDISTTKTLSFRTPQLIYFCLR